MFGLSTLWLRVAAMGVLLAALALGLYKVYSFGYDSAEAKYQLELANAKIDADAQSEVLQDRIDKTLAAARQKDRNAQLEINRLRVAVDDGSVRFSIPVASTGGPGAGPATQPARAELDRTVAGALIAITADGDQAILELNTCIAAYNEVKDQQNGKRSD